MDSDKLSSQQLIDRYLPEVKKLFHYIPWLESKKGQAVSGMYTGEGIYESVMKTPVYDSGLLAFVKEIDKSPNIDRNYVYTFSRHNLRTVKDELRFINGAHLRDMKELWDIMAKYIIKGRTQGSYWADGAEQGIYLAVLLKMKELVEAQQGTRID